MIRTIFITSLLVFTLSACSEERPEVVIHSVEYSSYGFEPETWRKEVKSKLVAAGVPAEEKTNPINGKVELVWPKKYDPQADPVLREVFPPEVFSLDGK